MTYDGQGRPVAMWLDGHGEVYMHRFDRAQQEWLTLDPPRELLRDNRGIFGLGRWEQQVTAVWSHQGAMEIGYYHDESGWTVGPRLPFPGGFGGSSAGFLKPQVVTMTNGDVVVAWWSGTPFSQVYVARFGRTSRQWRWLDKPAALLAIENESLSWPQLARTDDDTLYLLMSRFREDDRSTRTPVLLRYDPASDHWIDAHLEATDVGRFAQSTLAAGADNAFVAVLGIRDTVLQETAPGAPWRALSTADASSPCSHLDHARDVALLGEGGDLFAVVNDGVSWTTCRYAPAREEWSVLGGDESGFAIRTQNFVWDAGMIAGPQGQLGLVWHEAGQLNFKEYFDGQWTSLGTATARGSGISDPAWQAFAPDIAFDALGRIVVAWREDGKGFSTPHVVQVKRFDPVDQSWTHLDTMTIAQTSLRGAPSRKVLKSDPSGQPWLLWGHADGLLVSSWGADGTRTDLPPLTQAVSYQETDLDFLSDGSPVVAVLRRDGTALETFLSVFRFETSTQMWQPLVGGPANPGPARLGGGLQVVVTSHDDIALGWSETGARGRLIRFDRDSQSWQPWCDSSPFGIAWTSRFPRIPYGDGHVLAAPNGFTAIPHLCRLGATEWERVGRIDDRPSNTYSQELALASGPDAQPILGLSIGVDLHLRAFEPESHRWVDPLLGAPGGLSDSDAPSRSLALAYHDPDRRLCAVWTERGEVHPTVLARCTTFD